MSRLPSRNYLRRLGKADARQALSTSAREIQDALANDAGATYRGGRAHGCKLAQARLRRISEIAAELGVSL